MAATNQPEQKPLGVDAQQAANADLRAALSQTVAGLCEKVVAPGDNAVEDKKVDNTFLLLAGTHEGLVCKRPGTHVVGQPGAQLTRLVQPGGTPQYFTGLHFQSVAGSNNSALLVDVTLTTGIYRFTNCRFTKRSTDTAACVRLANGAKAIFSGCEFDGGAPVAAANLIDVVSANPADCIVIGCIRTAAWPYGAVTNVGSL